MKIPGKTGPHTHGFILIAVLWVAMLLAVFAMNHATGARLGMVRVQTAEQLFADAHVLRSALAWGEHEVHKYYANQQRLEATEIPEANVQIVEDAPEEPELRLHHPRYEPYTVSIAGRDVHVRIVGESGRLNVNRVSPAILESMLLACGVQAGVEATGIVNSILDWIDEDDLHRAEGAESDYYMALDQPYPAKNGPLESIEELLLIKGITPELYHGVDGGPGLIDFLTVSGQTDKIDINSASPMTLSLVAGISDEVRTRIEESRGGAPFSSLSDLEQILSVGDLGELARFFDLVPAEVVVIEAWLADPETGRQGRTIRQTVSLGR